MSAWATVLIALIGSAIGSVAGAYLTIEHEHAAQLRDRMIAAADDFVTGALQAQMQVWLAAAPPPRTEDAVMHTRKRTPEAIRRIQEATRAGASAPLVWRGHTSRRERERYDQRALERARRTRSRQRESPMRARSCWTRAWKARSFHRERAHRNRQSDGRTSRDRSPVDARTSAGAASSVYWNATTPDGA
jgi:hypothetical protein